MDFLNYVLNHWSEISAIILFIISAFAGVKKANLSSKEYAKAVASKIMFGMEKKALEYLNTASGQAKFKEVVSLGYDQFSRKNRFFVSKPDFEKIIQDLHDEAIKFVEANIEKQSPVATPDLTVSPNGNVVANNVTVTGTTDAQKTLDAITEGLKRLGVNVYTNLEPTPSITTNGIAADVIVAPESQIKQSIIS